MMYNRNVILVVGGVIFIAIIILLAGSQAISPPNGVENNECNEKIQLELNDFSKEIQNVIEGKGNAQFRFSLDNCAAKINDCIHFPTRVQSQDVQCVILIDTADPNICSSLCSTTKDICMIMQLKNSKNIFNACVDTPIFVAGDAAACPNRGDEGWLLRDLQLDFIPEGSYLVSLSESSPMVIPGNGATFPVICAYWMQ